MPDAESIIEALRLRPHPEGGHYVETWRADAPADERPAGTAIYYLLRAGEQARCPHCDAKAEVYSRIVGYLRPVEQWNDGKQAEFLDRRVYQSGATQQTVS